MPAQQEPLPSTVACTVMLCSPKNFCNPTQPTSAVQGAGQAAAAVRQATWCVERHASEAAASQAALSGCMAGLARALEQCAGLARRLRTEEAARKARSCSLSNA